MSQFHFDPSTYADLMRAEVPNYARLQHEVARASDGVEARRVLDPGTGTGETLAAVLARHPGAAAVGIDENPAMLEAAATRLAALKVDLVAADLSDPLPPGPFDLVVSALAVHHLDGPAKAVTPVSDDYDRPSTPSDQLVWLADAGFEATTTWSERDLVVVRADRPG